MKIRKSLKAKIGTVVVYVLLNSLSFASGKWAGQRNNLGNTLIRFSYQVGFRDGLQQQLAMDHHDSDRVLPGDLEK